jgi:hypothetical protein
VKFASQKMIITKSENQKLLTHKGELFNYFYKQISINNESKNWIDIVRGAYEQIWVSTHELEDALKKELEKDSIIALKNIFDHLNIKTVDEISKIISTDVRYAEDILNEINRGK